MRKLQTQVFPVFEDHVRGGKFRQSVSRKLWHTKSTTFFGGNLKIPKRAKHWRPWESGDRSRHAILNRMCPSIGSIFVGTNARNCAHDAHARRRAENWSVATLVLRLFVNRICWRADLRARIQKRHFRFFFYTYECIFIQMCVCLWVFVEFSLIIPSARALRRRILHFARFERFKYQHVARFTSRTIYF